jgi:hypothetical protein
VEAPTRGPDRPRTGYHNAKGTRIVASRKSSKRGGNLRKVRLPRRPVDPRLQPALDVLARMLDEAYLRHKRGGVQQTSPDADVIGRAAQLARDEERIEFLRLDAAAQAPWIERARKGEVARPDFMATWRGRHGQSLLGRVVVNLGRPRKGETAAEYELRLLQARAFDPLTVEPPDAIAYQQRAKRRREPYRMLVLLPQMISPEGAKARRKKAARARRNASRDPKVQRIRAHARRLRDWDALLTNKEKVDLIPGDDRALVEKYAMPVLKGKPGRPLRPALRSARKPPLA